MKVKLINMKKHFLKTITGFTLAEVLITLTIIGVIAALTIPSLITNIQDAQYRTAWKKDFSDLNAATKRIMMDNGGTFKDLCAPYNLYGRNDCLKALFANYLSVVNQCSAGQGLNNCFVNTASPTYDSALVLNNGAVISFRHYFSDCSGDGYGPWCTEITVDVNGLKGPNIIGKDVFGAYTLQDGLTPKGSSRLGAGMGYIHCDPSNLWTCSALYLKQ